MLHVTLDLYNCNPQTLVDRSYLEATFTALPALVEMEQVSPTTIFDITTSIPDDDGMSGFIVIATSHLAFHAWPFFGMMNFDIFSCEPYDADVVKKFLQEKFSPQKIEENRVERGLQAPRPQRHPTVPHKELRGS